MKGDLLHTAECVLKVGKLVRELAATINPSDLDIFFHSLRGDLGDVQKFWEAQYAEPTSAA